MVATPKYVDVHPKNETCSTWLHWGSIVAQAARKSFWKPPGHKAQGEFQVAMSRDVWENVVPLVEPMVLPQIVTGSAKFNKRYTNKSFLW